MRSIWSKAQHKETVLSHRVCFRVSAEAGGVSTDEPLRQIQTDSGTEGSDTQRTCEARFILCLYTCQVMHLIYRPVPMHLSYIISQHVGWDQSCGTVESLTDFPDHDWYLFLGRSYLSSYIYCCYSAELSCCSFYSRGFISLTRRNTARTKMLWECTTFCVQFVLINTFLIWCIS